LPKRKLAVINMKMNPKNRVRLEFLVMLELIDAQLGSEEIALQAES
jgi:hypothetical protein